VKKFIISFSLTPVESFPLVKTQRKADAGIYLQHALSHPLHVRASTKDK
jgi:hypothetical protein